MKRIKKFFIKRKLLKNELARLIKRCEYLELKLERQREKESATLELLKVYEAVILYLGEKLLKTENLSMEDYRERVGEILKLIRIF